MRYISIYFSLLLLLLAACTEDSFEPVDVSPPSDLSLRFDIAKDDSGDVTIYPEAVGAALFDVFLGINPNETPEQVQPGNGVSATYPEGTYTVRAIAYNLEGESIETSQELNIQLTPPANLQVEVTIDPINTNEVTVTPTADNATLFDIFFGEAMDEEATQIMPGASAAHTYAASGEYTLRVIARSASSTTLEYTEVLNIILPAAALNLPIDFENPDVNYVFEEFGGANLSVIDNPDASGENTSARVGRLFKMSDSEVWAGGLLTLPEPIDFSINNQFSIKVWSPKNGAIVRLKVENLDDANIFFELDATTTTSNTWETLTYDMSSIDQGNEYSKVVLFMDFGNPGDDSDYYFDDIVLGVGSSAPSLSLPIDFESDDITYTFTDFGDAGASRIDNPDPSGINTSEKVGQLVKANGAQTWGGSFLELPAPIDFSAGTDISVKVWSPKEAITVLLKIENADNGDIFVETSVTTTSVNAWETLTFDMSGIDPSQEYSKVVLFFDFGTTGDGSTYYFDDITLN
ncbi:MAG: hypothetical protein AAF798_06340 [Bacteroidota bacterium]